MSQQYSSHGANNDRNESFGQQNPEVNMNPDQKIPSTTHIFYKTRMCYTFAKGNCRKGDSCTFAHGPHDLRQPPPNWQEFVKENNGGNGNASGIWNDEEQIIQRMRICRNFYNGNECPYGKNCTFLHENPAKFKVEAPMAIGTTRETTVINIQTVVDHSQSQLGSNQVAIGTMNSTAPNGVCASVKGSYRKTRMCGKWETTGKCALADNCSFAHGSAELNTPVRRAEGEGYAQGHPYAGSSEHLNPIHGTSTTQLATGSGNVVQGQQGEHQPRGFLKLANKKLNRIYGDWIDDEED